MLAGSADLRTDACCTTEAPPPAVGAALANVHEEVRARYYGCGLVAPDAMEGLAVLDLGSGSGQDAYLLAQMVGPGGSVTGVDATPEQLEIAERHRSWHAERFGFANTRFIEGDIERLDALDLADESFDLIVSNCVINLVSDKGAVFRAAHRLLKPAASFISPTFTPTAAFRPRSSPIRCFTANASPERSTGATSRRWRKPPGSPTRAS